jgi:hypothetical protein
VYEALLSYRGFIAEDDLYEVKRAGDKFNELDVGYFVKENELSQYTEDERVRYETGENRGKLRMYKKGTFIYRLAGREREKSASYYTPEVLTKCLVKYALKELLEGKTADEILHLTICEPAMGSAAFLNEAINQLAEAYIDRKQKELGETISYEKRFDELQRVKMYIADRNVYGIDLNPVAVELAEVSLWLNTIFSGGFVPWFGTQLVCGNSLIGARRQCYTVSQLQANGSHWYESAPERVPVSTKRKPKTQIYHFFAGDTGMSNYTDKVIKSLASDDIKAIKDWNKKFTKPFTDDEIKTALRLSDVVDSLWEQVIALRREIDEKTSDPLTVYGQPEETAASRTTIREKDMIYKKLYLSEEMRNAGPYARLKFAMDYWCTLWFWPIEKADLLPTRSEFLADMGFILEGTIDTFAAVSKEIKMGQLSFFPSEAEQLVMDMTEQYRGMGVVDIPKLCQQQPRLALVRQIAEQNHFMHWELEFADLFAECGGFDLVIGNPPWKPIRFEELDVLSDSHPILAIRKTKASEITPTQRKKFFECNTTKTYYLESCLENEGQKCFLSSIQNYPITRGQQTDLFKCFLPVAWNNSSTDGVSAFVHPDNIYYEPNGVLFREQLYPRLRYHFQFINEKMLFKEIPHAQIFGLNVYSSPKNLKHYQFYTISNLFDPKAIDECFETQVGEAEGIKDNAGNWSKKGHPDRLLVIGEEELSIFSKLYDENVSPLSARLISIHIKELLEVIQLFSNQKKSLSTLGDKAFMSGMWHQTYSVEDNILIEHTSFPECIERLVCQGTHVGVANPIFKTPRRNSVEKADCDPVDLSFISADYLPRSNYNIAIDFQEYYKKDSTFLGKPYHSYDRVVARMMLNLKQERTLNVSVFPGGVSHINGLVGIAFADYKDMLIAFSSWASVPIDYFVKAIGKSNFNYATASLLPIIDTKYNPLIIQRGVLLNCLTKYYANIFSKAFQYIPQTYEWSKNDNRLSNKILPKSWDYNTPFRNDYERRQALIEIDVLVALALGMTLKQLRAIYKLQFAIAQQYEIDTWYDANGRIVFTNNRSLTGIGFSRPEFENPNVVTPIRRSDAPWDGIMKHAPAGYVFARTITDDTMPGGPIERTIEYHAPFDRCDREQDYETAWNFFEEKYGGQA